MSSSRDEDSWVKDTWSTVKGWFGGEEKLKIVFPEKDGQIKHIFAKRRGHVEDTPENRKLILDTASDPNNYVGTAENGNDWFQKVLPSGEQVWVKVRDNIITNAGINKEAVQVDKLTAKYNLKKNGR